MQILRIIDNKFSGLPSGWVRDFTNDSYGEGYALERGLIKLGHVISTFIFEEESPSSNSVLVNYLNEHEGIIVFFNSRRALLYFSQNEGLKKIVSNHCVTVWDGTGESYKGLIQPENIYTCSPTLQEVFVQRGYKASLLYFTYLNYLERFSLAWEDKSEVPVFAGSINVRNSSHYQRINLLFTIRKFANIYINFGDRRVIKLLYLLVKRPLLGMKYLVLFFYSKGTVNGEDYYRLLGRSKIVINNHLDQTRTTANIRCWEVASLGALLITDYLDDTFDVLDAGSIFTYRSLNDLKTLCQNLKGIPDSMKSSMAKRYSLYMSLNYSESNRAHGFIEQLPK